MGYYLSNSLRANCYFGLHSQESFEKCLELLRNCVDDNYISDKLLIYSYKCMDSYKHRPQSSYRKDMDFFIEVNKAYNEKFVVSFGDGQIKRKTTGFVKTKRLGVPDASLGSILLKFNSGRHWKHTDIEEKDIPWKEKRGGLIWRGAPTGNRHGLRKKLVSTYFDKYNIGYSGSGSSDVRNKYILGHVSVSEQLLNKYVLSIEGNDVATNLKWILASNSIPIMPKPTRESWLLESQLIPYVHYVPINDDLDDLDEVYKWCINNDDHCKQIAENGKRYMEMFFDEENEKEIYRMIYERYKQFVGV